MNKMPNNQDNLNKNTQGQGSRNEQSREGRETMRGSDMAGEENRGISARSGSETEIEGDDDFEDTEESSLDSAGDEEDEDTEVEGTERSDLGFRRDRGNEREQSDRI